MQLLGRYIEEHGSGESYGVVFSDAKEAWYLESAGGHLWLAQRLPDDAVFVSANQGRLQVGRRGLGACAAGLATLGAPLQGRSMQLLSPMAPLCPAPQEVDLEDKQNVLHSPGLEEFAAREGLWDPAQGGVPVLRCACRACRPALVVDAPPARRALQHAARACGAPLPCCAGPFNWLAAFMEDSEQDAVYNYPRVAWLQSELSCRGAPGPCTGEHGLRLRPRPLPCAGLYVQPTSPDQGPFFPVFQPPARPLNLTDVMAGLRQHYQGWAGVPMRAGRRAHGMQSGCYCRAASDGSGTAGRQGGRGTAASNRAWQGARSAPPASLRPGLLPASNRHAPPAPCPCGAALKTTPTPLLSPLKTGGPRPC